MSAINGNALDKYSLVANKLRRRYTSPEGVLILSSGVFGGQQVKTKYKRLENIALVKYLRCDPVKMGCKEYVRGVQ